MAGVQGYRGTGGADAGRMSGATIFRALASGHGLAPVDNITR